MPTEQSSTITIRIEDDAIFINDKEFREAPALIDLRQILGDPQSPPTKISIGERTSYEWSWQDIGVQASGCTHVRLTDIGIVLDESWRASNTRGWNASLKNFSGRISIGNVDRYPSESANDYAERVIEHKKGRPFRLNAPDFDKINWTTRPEIERPYRKHAAIGLKNGSQINLPASESSLHLVEAYFSFPDEKTVSEREVEQKSLSQSDVSVSVPATIQTINDKTTPPLEHPHFPANASDYRQPISVREDGSYSGGFRRETGAIFARWFWGGGWVFFAFLVAFVFVILYMLLR